MTKTEHQVYKQDGAIIHTLHPTKTVYARIYSNEQRQTIQELISQGFLPHHTSVGVGKSTQANWNIESYKGRFGQGFKMITTSPISSKYNHLTYFIKQAS